MIVCPACKHHNPEGAKLCAACGRGLEGFAYRVCPSCGALNAARHAFCHRCFAELTLAEGESPIPDSSLVKPFTPVIVSLGEEALQELKRIEELPTRPAAAEPTPATPATVKPEAQAPLEAPTERPAPAEVAPIAPAEAPEIAPPSVEAVAPPSEAEIAQLAEGTAGPTEVAAQPPTMMAAQPTAPIAEAPILAEAAAPTQAEALPAEATPSPLEGVDEALPLEPVVTLPHRAPRRAARPAAPTGDYEAELFQQVAVERAPLQEGAQEVLPRKAQVLSRVGRIVLCLLVLLAALLPHFTGGQTGFFVEPREAVRTFAQELEALPAEAEVLLSFDYSPTYAGELDPLALAVVRHLARRSVRMVVMSTKPEGIGLAEGVYRTVTGELPSYLYGEHYALLGYLPGQEAGLRALNAPLAETFRADHVQSHPLGELAATSGLATLKDFDLVIILTDDSLILRRWIEQVQSRNDIGFYALVTSAIEPLLVPYQQSGQLRTLIPAATGAAEYEVASAVKPATLPQSDAYAALFVVLLVTAIVTNVLYITKGERVK